jgi:hypothetical protein
MNFDSMNGFEAIGPSAALVFASWSFLGLLEQRYVTLPPMGASARGLKSTALTSQAKPAINISGARCARPPTSASSQPSCG